MVKLFFQSICLVMIGCHLNFCAFIILKKLRKHGRKILSIIRYLGVAST